MSSEVWDLSRGFLPAQDPIEKLPKKYRAWNELAEEAPKLLAAGQFGKRIKDLPILDTDELESDEELECAMRYLSFFGHGEVWESWQSKPKQSISAPVAIPWCRVAKKLDRPPILSYASYAPYNWRRLDRKKPIALGNLVLIQSFLGGIDEEWFILDHVEIDFEAIPLIASLCFVNEPLFAGNWDVLESVFNMHAETLANINATLLRMPENCDPYVYYNRVRPYIHGWKGNPRLSEGVVYDGVKELKGKRKKWRGETGAQSGVIPSVDIFLGIEHNDKLSDGSPDTLKTYLIEMRDYMPKEHRQFLESLENIYKRRLHIREFVIKNKLTMPKLVDAYNACVNEVAKFRETHLKYAEGYINKQAEKSPYNPTGTGTGGTPFMKYLKKHLDETRECLIS